MARRGQRTAIVGADRTAGHEKRTALQAATEKMAKADPTGARSQVMASSTGHSRAPGRRWAWRATAPMQRRACSAPDSAGWGTGGTNPAKPPAQPFGAPQTPTPARAAASSSGAFGTASPSATGGGASPFATPSQPTSAFGGAHRTPSPRRLLRRLQLRRSLAAARRPRRLLQHSAPLLQRRSGRQLLAPGGVGFAGAASTSGGGAFGATCDTRFRAVVKPGCGGGSVFGGAAAATPAFGKPSAMGMGGAAAPAFGQPSGLGAGSRQRRRSASHLRWDPAHRHFRPPPQPALARRHNEVETPSAPSPQEEPSPRSAARRQPAEALGR